MEEVPRLPTEAPVNLSANPTHSMSDKNPVIRHSYLDPGTQCTGMYTVDPLSIPPGGVQVLQNGRIHRGYFNVRGAIAVKTTSGITTGTLKGWTKVSLAGTEYSVVAIRSSSTTKVYISSDTGSTPTYTEITGVAGQYPDTRFGDDGNVCFSVVRDPSDSSLSPFTNTSGWDILVFSNGFETMAYYPASGLYTAACTPIVKAWHPGQGYVFQCAGFPLYYDTTAAQINSAYTHDGDTTCSKNTAWAATGGLAPYATVETTVATDGSDYFGFTFAAGVNWSQGRDLCIVYGTSAFADPWSCLKVQVRVGAGAFVTVYDPTVNDMPPVVAGDKSFSMVAFKIDPTVVTSQSYDDIRFTWVAKHAPAAQAKIWMFAFLGGGYVRGDYTMGISYYNPSAWTESIGVVAEGSAPQKGRKLGLMGLQDARNDIEVPVSILAHYAYYVTYQSPAQADLNKGLSFVLAYGAESSTADMRLMASKVLGTYSGSWTLTNTALSMQTITVNPATVQSARRMPDGLNEPIPACSAMTGASGRLFCGKCVSWNAGSSGTSNALGGDVMFSDQDNAFRFRGIPSALSDGSIDERSGGKVLFHGEQVQNFARITGQLNDQDTVLAVTDQGAWMFGGRTATALNRPVRVSKYGTKSPWSVTSYKNIAFWLDADKQMRALDSGEAKSISRDRFESFTLVGTSITAGFQAIPDSRLANVSSFCFRDFLYVFMTPAAQSTNVVVGVYDIIKNTWVCDYPTYSVTFGGAYSLGDELRFWTEAGALLELDAATGTQDGGTTDITVGIKFPETRASLIEEAQFNVPWVMAEADSGKTLTMLITGRKKASNTSSGTKSLTSSAAYVLGAPNRNVGIEDNSAYLTVSGAMSARKKIISAGMHVTLIPSTDPFTRD